MDHRAFLKTATLPCLVACAAPGAPAKPAANDAQFTIEARFYEKLPNKKTKCKLCPRECVIDDHERGYCGVRENRGGTYYSLVYSRVCLLHSHRGLQRQLQDVPELGDLAVPARTGREHLSPSQKRARAGAAV